MTVSKIEDLNVEELMALLFLVSRENSFDGLSGQGLRNIAVDPAFQAEWVNERNRLKGLVKYYPDQEEEKHYLTAMLDAVYGLDPFSEETEHIKDQLMPLISELIKV